MKDNSQIECFNCTEIDIMLSTISKRMQKLVLVLVTFTLLTEIREEAVEKNETLKAGKDSKESKSEYSENLAQVLCPSIFGKSPYPC